MKVLIPGLCVDAMELDTALKDGAFDGTTFIGKERNSFAYEMPPVQVKSLLEECYERTSDQWGNGASERAAFSRLAKRLKEQLAKAEVAA